MTAPTTGSLTGVGVGPGDPDLVTVRGLTALREADVVFVPVSADAPDEQGYAERVVRHHLTGQAITRLPFALGAWSHDPAERQAQWDEAAAPVVAALAEGADAAFATIGDPNVYATFTYLARAVRRALPHVGIQTVPGITAMQDLAARTGTVLVEGDQTLVLLPITAGEGPFRQALAEHDTVVAYKGGRRLPAVRAAIEAAGRLDQAVFGARLGLDDEAIGDVPDGRAPYLSTVIVTREDQP